MSESFDPYRVWLSIPPESRPPTHYQLLGISPDEHDPTVINAAVMRQSAYVRNFQIGKYVAEATQILNEIAAAKACLLDPGKRATYNAELHAAQPSRASPRGSTVAPAAPVGAGPAPMIDLDALAAAAPGIGDRVSVRRLSTKLGGPRKKPALAWQLPAAVGGIFLLVLAIIAVTRRPPVAASADGAAMVDLKPDFHAEGGGTLRAQAASAPLTLSTSPSEPPSADDIVFADFEDEDYGGWRASGTAFGSSPVAGTLPGQASVTGFEGKKFVNTFIDYDQATGKLVSPGFTIERQYITFRIGAACCRQGRASIDLIVKDGVARSATAGNRNGSSEQLERLEPAGWDVGDLIGMAAHLEIVDDSISPWGHISVDQITFSNRVPAHVPIALRPVMLPTPRPSLLPSWSYGYAKASQDGILEFAPLPYFNGSDWQGGLERPDPQLDWACLNAAGGHPGRHCAVVRRWVSPAEGVISVAGTLTHKDQEAVSDGVQGRIAAAHGGTKGEWRVRAGSVKTDVEMFNVAASESVDFVVDCLAHESFDIFDWPVRIDLETENGEFIGTWDSVRDFARLGTNRQPAGFDPH